MLVGPRACGKTTTAARRAASLLRLDRPEQAAVVAADPDAALAGLPRPTLIDEWQLVPEVLGAVKRSVDAGAEPGSFLITGSVRADLGSAGWPMTGRVIRLPIWGLSQLEITGGADGVSFLDRVRDAPGELQVPHPAPDLRGYVEQALAGGFPELLDRPSPSLRGRYTASYVDQVVRRDASLAGHPSDPVRLRDYLRALAANTSGVPVHKTLYDAASIARATALGYDDLLESLMVAERVPVWANSRLGRLVHLPKRYLVEPALLGPLLGIDARAVLRDGDLLGRLIDSYVVAQLRPELERSSTHAQLYHLRDSNGRHEVDLVVEFANGDVIAIEVKAASAPKREDARHLRWLRDQIGERFVAGIVFHTGSMIFRHEPDIHYLPIATIWGSR